MDSDGINNGFPTLAFMLKQITDKANEEVLDARVRKVVESALSAAQQGRNYLIIEAEESDYASFKGTKSKRRDSPFVSNLRTLGFQLSYGESSVNFTHPYIKIEW